MSTQQNQDAILKACAAIAISDCFDAQFYLDQNPDVRASRIDPILHYVLHGEAENRRPTREFDPAKARLIYATDANLFAQYLTWPNPYIDANRQPVPIVFGCNDEFALYLSIALESLKATMNINDKYEIFVLYTGKDSGIITQITSQATVHFRIIPIYVGDRLESLMPAAHTSGHITRDAYIRLLIPEMFNDYDKILYLDCDLIVQKDISLLYNYNLSQYAIGAVCDYFINNDFYNTLRSSIQSDNITSYFNSGVIIFNNKFFTEHNLGSKLIALAASGRKFCCHDQDILNIVCNNSVFLVEDEWNFRWQYHIMNQISLMSHADAKKYYAVMNNPWIIHYSSWHKPLNTWDKVWCPYFWRLAAKSPLFDRLLKQCKYPVPRECYE